MAKKKEKPRIINNIQELNLEIDYDKLAEAVVMAQRKSKGTPEEIASGEIGFWKSIWYIIQNKKKTSGEILAEAMSLLMSFVFNILATLLLLGGIVCVGIFFVYIFRFVTGQLPITFDAITILSLGLLLAVFALLMRGIANDISWEKDRNYIVAIFSSIVSFAALIVALIALFNNGASDEIIAILNEIKDLLSK